MSKSNNGWVKLHRSILENAVWQCSTPGQKAVLITIMLLANSKPNKWIWKGKKYELKAGQLITSRESLSKQARVSEQTVRGALKRFEMLEFITSEATSEGTLITIVNWELYQGRETTDNQPNTDKPTNEQPANNQPTTSNKNNKNNKNDKKKEYSADFEKAYKAYPRKGDKAQAFDNYLARIKAGFSPEELFMATEAYAAECKARGTNEMYIKLASTFYGVHEPFVDYLNKEKQRQKKQDLSSFFDISESNNTPPYFGLPKEWFDGESLVESRVEPIWHPRMHGLPEGTESKEEVINTFNLRKRGWHEYNKRKGESSGTQ